MADWYRCVDCQADLRSCRHTNTCPLLTDQKSGETGRVRSVIATSAALRPRKGFEVIQGGRTYQEEERQNGDS
ncbi:MAG: hypothetical protein ACYTE8_01020 [Planctomycetota bacterium]|jgi:hypothetical protein